jgi:tRNA1Val (adenine37-N6)-methyltransferase
MDESFSLGKYDIFVDKNHRFGTDAVLLSAFAKIKRSDTVVDLCTGCGIIPLLLMQKYRPKQVFGVEIQQEAYQLFEKSVKHNGLTDTVIPILGDLRQPLGLVADAVTVNPPYYKEKSGFQREDDAQAIARHELMCTLEDVISCAAGLLKFGGMLYLCHIPQRLCDVMALLRQYRIEPKHLVMVQGSEKSAPYLVLVQGKKGAKPGMNVDKPLIVRQNGEFTQELLKAYE